MSSTPPLLPTKGDKIKVEKESVSRLFYCSLTNVNSELYPTFALVSKQRRDNNWCPITNSGCCNGEWVDCW